MNAIQRRVIAALGVAAVGVAAVGISVTMADASSVATAGWRRSSPADSDSAFIYRGGRFTALRQIPGAVGVAHSGINNAGQITGIYGDKAVPDPDAPGAIKGFAREASAF
jgi:hypothetical protein